MTALSDCVDQKVDLHNQLGVLQAELVVAHAAEATLLAICMGYQRDHEIQHGGGYHRWNCPLCGKLDEVMGKL